MDRGISYLRVPAALACWRLAGAGWNNAAAGVLESVWGPLSTVSKESRIFADTSQSAMLCPFAPYQATCHRGLRARSSSWLFDLTPKVAVRLVPKEFVQDPVQDPV